MQVSRIFVISVEHYAAIRIHLLFSNNRNLAWCVVLGLSQEGMCIDLFENFSVNSLKPDLSKNATFNPPLFLNGQYL
jgi:hypothetical protein